jgi:hypothetical protein
MDLRQLGPEGPGTPAHERNARPEFSLSRNVRKKILGKWTPLSGAKPIQNGL